MWLWIAVPLGLCIAWWYTALTAQISFPQLKGKAIVLLIAHPDDEAMFFSPTVIELTRPALKNHVKILCLSNGNADGLGKVRSKEIVASGLLLGLKSESDVMVLDSPDFEDSMTVTWPAERIATLLSFMFVKPDPKSTGQKRKTGSAASAGPDEGQPTIDALITFDDQGVSSHPNHISLYHGAKAWVKSLKIRSNEDPPVELYTLTSIPIFRKYIGGFDVINSIITCIYSTWKSRKRDRSRPVRMMFMSGPRDYLKGQSAMTSAHKSQMRWFRWGWILLSRYMVVNDLKRETVRS